MAAKYQQGDKARDEHGHVVTITGLEESVDRVVYIGEVDCGHAKAVDRFLESQLYPLNQGKGEKGGAGKGEKGGGE